VVGLALGKVELVLPIPESWLSVDSLPAALVAQSDLALCYESAGYRFESRFGQYFTMSLFLLYILGKIVRNVHRNNNFASACREISESGGLFKNIFSMLPATLNPIKHYLLCLLNCQLPTLFCDPDQT
jgi:hypothetical protein